MKPRGLVLREVNPRKKEESLGEDSQSPGGEKRVVGGTTRGKNDHEGLTRKGKG